MARRIKFEIEGLNEILKQLEKTNSRAEMLLQQVAKENIETVFDTAKSLVPVDSGALKDSLTIREEKSQKTGKKTYQVYSKGTSEGGVRYAFAVEYGTSRIKAQPFLRPALRKNKKQITENYKTALNKAIEGGI